ncbi:hypothetical protein [Aminobacterium mobile]|uniref:hypothetical protein n=1 Tax=Aminobacterium mobile TaxID=81467 RepID=UPI0004BA42C6|nr:hypothetical protein [Aminobacterium mobile]
MAKKIIPEKEVQKKAYLPHIFFRSCIFPATRAPMPRGAYARNGKIYFQQKNNFGEEILVSSREPLRANPEMGVFLGVLALLQKYGAEKLVGADTGTDSGRYMSSFPLSELYDICRAGRGAGRENVRHSVEILGEITLAARFSGGNEFYSNFWATKIEKRGRKGAVATIYPLRFFIPEEGEKKECLYADAAELNSINSDTARGIYWALIPRQHFAGTPEDFQKLIGAQTDIWQFERRGLIPALEELEKIKFTIAKNNDGKYIISRPKSTKTGRKK